MKTAIVVLAAPNNGDEAHPLHRLYAPVRPSVAGVSDACATIFGARDGVAAAGLDVVAQHEVDGIGGPPSLAALSADGWTVVTF